MPTKATPPKTTKATPLNDGDVAAKTPDPELRPGHVVFYEAAVYGEADPVVHVGVAIHVGAGRVRVKDLGPAGESADFAAADVRLNA